MKDVTFKKQENGKFKVVVRATGKLFEGWEDREFSASIVAARVFKKEMNMAPEIASPSVNKAIQAIDIAELSKVIASNTAEAMAKAMESLISKSTDGIKDEKERAEAEADIKTAVDELRTQKRYRLTLNEQENTDDPQQQFIGCNGVGWILKRGSEAIVPEGILNVIKGCVYRRGTQDAEGNIEYKDVKRFSFSYAEV